MNKLANEKSPYLLQHKDNPIDWYPWGEEALNKAKEENKPLFISIGYSTCHWCHEMNREAFSHDDVAEVLNKNFVAIKVDREERPDIDKVYMSFSEAMVGHGGWPLNVLATPEGEPFFVGTYFPKKSHGKMVGLIDLLEEIHKLWEEDEEKVRDEGRFIVKEVKDNFMKLKSGEINEDIFEETVAELNSLYDEKNGGFGTSPKFPMPQYIWFLLEYGHRNDKDNIIKIATDSLDKMYKGGIFDHIGYGFYRYSTDEQWKIPHFEKMLYDNALLSQVYIKAYELTKKNLYKDVAEKIFEFVIRDMANEEGGFYSALDADSEGVEGKYYLFTEEETISILGEEFGELYNKYYDISKEGNFQGKNNPNLINNDLNKIDKKTLSSLESMNQMLFTYRESRVAPHRDNKILTSWNGLMISALAKGGEVFENQVYIKWATKTADFIIDNCIDENGYLLSTYIDDTSYNIGYLEDYAFFTNGLIQLYKTTMDKKYLDKAVVLSEDMIRLFSDIETGGLYFYSKISEKLVLNPKDIHDGVLPSGSSFAIMNLMELFELTKDDRYINLAGKILKNFGEDINNHPLLFIYTLIGYKNFTK